jgi:hypothetical protein
MSTDFILEYKNTLEGLVWHADTLGISESPVMVWVELEELILRSDTDFALMEVIRQNHLIELKYLNTAYGLDIRVRVSISKDKTTFQTWLNNAGAMPILVKRIILVFINHSSPAVTDKSKRDWRLYIDSGTNAWCGVKRLNAVEYDSSLMMLETQRTLPFERQGLRFHESDLLTVLFDAESKRALLFGVIASISTHPTIEVRPDQSGKQFSDIRVCYALDMEISPSRPFETDPLIILNGANPLDLMEAFSKNVQEYYSLKPCVPLPKQPVIGYMSWYGHGTAITEKIILDNAQAAGDIFDGYPQSMRRVMLIDHGWQWKANWGKWDMSDPQRFPSGITSLGHNLAKMGWEMGLWYTPFCVTVDSPEHTRLSTWFAVDTNEQPLEREASVWGYNPDELTAKRPIHFLDSAVPEALEEVQSNLKRMQSWGVTFWKLDFFTVTTSTKRKSKYSPASLFQRVGEVIRETVRPEDVIMPCSTPTNRLVGMCNFVNIPADTGNAGKWPAHKIQFRRSYETTGASWFKHNTFWINDHQSVQLGEGCSLGEAHIRATHIAMSGGGLWLSEDVAQLPVDRVHIVQRILPIVGKAARPIDLFDSPYPEAYTRLWALPVHTNWDSWITLAVFNFDEIPYCADLDASLFKIAQATPFEAMEWWTSRRLGQHVGKITLHVPPNDVAIILAKPIYDKPWVLGTDLHFTGGSIIENVRWDKESLVLSGEVVTRAGLHGNIYGTHPDGFTISPKATQQARDNGSLGWHYRFETSRQRTPFNIPFTKYGAESG